MGLSFDVRRNQTIVAQALASALPPPRPVVFPEYEPASWQALEFHNSDQHIRGLFGGDRAGKSGTVTAEMIHLIRQFPGDVFWAAALTEEKIMPVWRWYKKLFAPEEILWDKIKWRISGLIPKIVPTIYGSLLEFKTMKAGSGAFSAEGVKAIHLDEDGQRVTTQMSEIFTDCCSRVLDNDGYVFVSATPVLGKNWMYYRLYLGNQENREDNQPDPDIKCWTVSLLDNQFISEEAKIKQKGRLTKDEIDRRFYGLFTTLEGAVFKELDDRIHYIPFFSIPCDWRIISGIDLGYVNAFCYLMAALSPDDELYFFAEHYQNEMLLKDHAQIIRKMELDVSLFAGAPMNLSGIPENRLCDHDRQERAELEECGIWTEAADKDVHFSIERINRLLKPKQNGRPSFFVMDSCPNLQREMQNYRYKEVRAGSEDKEQPIKENDHAVDAARYITLYCFPESMGDSEIESAAPSVFGGGR